MPAGELIDEPGNLARSTILDGNASVDLTGGRASCAFKSYPQRSQI